MSAGDLDQWETRPCEPRVSNEDAEDWCAVAQWEAERADRWKAEVAAIRRQVEEMRWIPVDESLPEDRENVGFIVDCKHNDFYHARIYGGRFHRSDWDNGWGGFNTPGYGARASHWCRLPPVDAIRSGEAGKEGA